MPTPPISRSWARAPRAAGVPTMERAFANDAQLSEPMFRLMRAARQGREWREVVGVTSRFGRIHRNQFTLAAAFGAAVGAAG